MLDLCHPQNLHTSKFVHILYNHCLQVILQITCGLTQLIQVNRIEGSGCDHHATEAIIRI